jgi:hypothetical protein
MNRLAGFILLGVGVVLLVWGFNAAHSAGSEISKFFNGAPTDRSLWLILGGAVSSVLGLSLAWSGTSRRA